MSAWIPMKEHIDLLVKTADVLDVHDHDNRDELGQMFVDEVVASVSYRYPDDDVQAGELPGPIPPWDYYNHGPFVYADPGFMPDAAEMRQLVGCYAYQACEHPGWESSEAHAICEAIMAKLGDGPRAGAWGWDERHVARRIAQGRPDTETVYG